MLELYSNSKVTSHRKCNRFHYWSYERNLGTTGISPPLIYGECWHVSMDIVWRAIKECPDLSNSEICELAHISFKECWSKFDLPSIDMMDDVMLKKFGARTPDTAFYMLSNYIEKRRSFIESIELLNVEQPFAVPLYPDNPNIFYVGKRDKDIRWDGRVWAVEHKSTSWGTAKNGFNSIYIETFSPNSQIEGYIHSLNMEYGKEAKGVLCDLALVTKNNHEHFMFLPIEKSIANLDAWLWSVRKEIENIEDNRHDLEHMTEGLNFMDTFPMNDTACIQFMKPCAFIDLCKTIPNPQDMAEKIPLGFVEKEGSPFEHLNLEKIGLTEEK